MMVSGKDWTDVREGSGALRTALEMGYESVMENDVLLHVCDRR